MAVEIRFRSIILAVLLTILLAMSNSYLALKIGLLTSASIPAAMISMGILRFFKNSSILENNIVQTAASAGEAVAGGIVYTIPALIIIQYWHHFDYFTNFFIAASGGILGVLFSIPLRRLLVQDAALKFPEGRAIAEVLKSTEQQVGIHDIFMGGVIGACLEFLQMGFKVLAGSFSHWMMINRSLFGFGVGFSATMIGAGYLIGHEMAISIILGALIAWVIAIPIISPDFPGIIGTGAYPEEALNQLWNSQMRYMGIGAMLFAGIWTFVKLLRPLLKNIKLSFSMYMLKRSNNNIPRTDKDIPMPFILGGVLLIAAIMFLFFQFIFPVEAAGLGGHYAPSLIFGAVLYVLIIGFLFSVITGYLSGMVGVTASPGSSVVIAGMLLAAWLLLLIINRVVPLPLTLSQIQAAEAITIIIGSVVTGIAAIANDNTQDLKVGQLVGATPWRQEMMLLLGVVVSALVIPPVMQLLFEVYGIAGIMPHEGMDKTQSLPAPVAALMAAITEAVFRNTLPWMMMLFGAGIILAVIIINKFLLRERFWKLSILGVAIGMYLPMSSSFPLFLGGMMAYFVQKGLYKKYANKANEKDAVNLPQRKQRGVLIACGLVAGSALMDVFLAIPFSIYRSPDALNIVGSAWSNYALMLSILITVLLFLWIKRRVCLEK